MTRHAFSPGRGPGRRFLARRGGFTLIEIMVVVVILGILAGALVPNLGSALGRTRLDGAAWGLRERLDFCGQSAAATGRVHALVFSGVRSGKLSCMILAEEAGATEAETGNPYTERGTDRDTNKNTDSNTDSNTDEMERGDNSESSDARNDVRDAQASDSEGQPQIHMEPVALPGASKELLPEGVKLVAFNLAGPGGVDPEDKEKSDTQPDERDSDEAASLADNPDEENKSAMTTRTGREDEEEADAEPRILFYPDGTADFATLTLADRDGDQRVISLNGLSGAVTIAPGAASPRRGGPSVARNQSGPKPSAPGAARATPNAPPRSPAKEPR